MEMKDRLIEELYGAVMQALRDSLEEQRRLVQNFNDSLDDDIALEDNFFDESMLLDLAEDRILDAISESVESMIEDGDIKVHED